MPSTHFPVDDAPARDVSAPIPEDFRLSSGQRLAATQASGRLHGPTSGL